MKIKRFLAAWSIIWALGASAVTWQPDTLGPGYEMARIDQPDDYAGKACCTVVRHLAPDPIPQHVAILYVHGFNDYFFQTDMADFFARHGIDFYAVDLRKYGRSILPGNKMFQVRDLREYFADIDSALSVMRQSGISDVILMGHSTGGLVTSYYLSEEPAPMVKGLILNSPFLDWNLSKTQERVLIPMVDCVAGLSPNLRIKQGDSTAYSESLLAGEHGRWSYNTDWKLKSSPDVDAGWIRAIDDAQAVVQRGNTIKIPILLMHSDRSVYGNEWTEDFNHGDAVLSVDDISKYGRRLGPSVTEVTVKGGLHDLVLSESRVEQAVLSTMLAFINRLGYRTNKNEAPASVTDAS